jgi:HlyD family secretion protein
VITAAKVTAGPISQTIGYNGTVQAADSVSVVPVISGRITKLNVDVGSQVKAGDVIAELDKSTLNAQVAQAQSAVAAAAVKVDQIKAGARPESIAAANANAASAQAKLDAVKNGARAETIAESKLALDTAKSKLATVQAGARPETVAQAKSSLDTANSKLTQLLNGPTPDQVAASKLSVEQAKDTLLSSQTNRDGVCAHPGYACDASQATVSASQTALDLANQNLKTLVDPPTQDAIDQAKLAVVSAQQAYQLAQKPYTDQDLAQAQAAVASAQQAYQLASAPYTAQDLAQAQAAADQAKQQAMLTATPYTDLDLKSAQSAVDQAQAALDIAKVNLSQADILAPFDGVVSAKLLSVGSLASAATPIVTLISPHLQVQFSIDEGRISAVKTGQTVSLTTSAYPGKQFAAQVKTVSPSADSKTHTFAILVEPTDDSGSLRAGMFVMLNVTVASFASATLVPNQAIVQQGAQSIVMTIVNNTAHVTPITAGIADDKNTQIISGVNPGDQVATSNQATLAEGAPIRIAGQPTSGNAGATRAGAGTPAAATDKPGTTPSPSPQG